MKTFKTLLLLLWIATGLVSCNKDWYLRKADSFYIENIYEDDILVYHFDYENKTLKNVCYYYGGSTDTFLTDSGYKIYDELGMRGKKAFEFDEQGRCTKITYYKSLPDSIYCYMNLFYESDNLSKIDWYGGDGTYSGNYTYQYDTVPNALYVLNEYVEPNVINYWKYQPNHCIGQNSDVEDEYGYTEFFFVYSFSFPYSDGCILWLYSFTYTYNKYGLPEEAVYHIKSEPENLHRLRFEYVKL
jgi:hypothetical protein